MAAEKPTMNSKMSSGRQFLSCRWAKNYSSSSKDNEFKNELWQASPVLSMGGKLLHLIERLYPVILRPGTDDNTARKSSILTSSPLVVLENHTKPCRAMPCHL
jgi:hypothetical protein